MRKTSEMMGATHKRNSEPVDESPKNCRHEWVDDGMFTLVCVHCGAEEHQPPEGGGCAYEVGDWACREGGYLWYAGDGEGWDPEDCTHICPHCRTKDYLESAKEEAESCSSYSNNGSSGTGLDIWTAAEKLALTANHPAACKALAEIGPVSALDDDDVVICNTQQVAP